jgi:tetratricopeptide (TPR) repeat protein
MRTLAAVALLALAAACGTPRSAAGPGAAGASVTTESARQPRPEVLVARARALRAEGDLAGAHARLEAALAQAPGDEGARLELADLLLADASDLDRAQALLAGVPKTTPRAHLLAARLSELRGDDAGAAGAYERALDAGDDDPDVRLRRALALDRLGRAPEAIPELERVREARPDDAIARTRLAALYEAAGRVREAEAEYRALAEAHPDRAQGWDALAAFCERTGRREEARLAHAKAREARGSSTTSARELRPLLPSRR